MLIDSNIIIYAAKPEHHELRPLVQITTDILECATRLRQQRPIGLGDALIGATALVHNLKLLTANTADFQWIPDLRFSSKFEEMAG